MRTPLPWSAFPVLACLLAFFAAGCRPAEETPQPVSAQPSETPAAELTADVSHAKPLSYINPLTPEQIEEGWLLLFDNETLFGWSGDPGINWHVADQAIAASEGPIGLLLTTVRFADFELSLEFKGSPGSNGGVFVRCAEAPSDPATDCYEVNIADDHPQGFLSGSLVAHAPSNPGFSTTDDNWHQMHVSAVGNLFRVSIDGRDVCEFRDERSGWRPSGLIGLQKNSGELAYRNIRIKPLGSRELFNGTDLAGWREVPGGKSVIDVVDGSIHVVNGPGFLETEGTFQDFLVQFEARTHAPELNSGLFFRAERGTEQAPSNGYEVQIHNGFHEGDRNRPNNAGTGAIFRRVEARRVVADDLSWATITLLADGPQIATWVQGYPVVNWRDQRTPDPNPRKGLRLEAGHLSLQGHDPTTDMSFRRIRLAELPPKN